MTNPDPAYADYLQREKKKAIEEELRLNETYQWLWFASLNEKNKHGDETDLYREINQQLRSTAELIGVYEEYLLKLQKELESLGKPAPVLDPVECYEGYN